MKKENKEFLDGVIKTIEGKLSNNEIAKVNILNNAGFRVDVFESLEEINESLKAIVDYLERLYND